MTNKKEIKKQQITDNDISVLLHHKKNETKALKKILNYMAKNESKIQISSQQLISN